MKTEKSNRGLIAKTLLAGLTIMLLVSAAPYRASKENTASRALIICHFGRTIMIDARAWPAHRDHGDELGACSDVPIPVGKTIDEDHCSPTP